MEGGILLIGPGLKVSFRDIFSSLVNSILIVALSFSKFFTELE